MCKFKDNQTKMIYQAGDWEFNHVEGGGKI